LFSDTWFFEDEGEDGFESPGHVEMRIDNTWDYVHLSLRMRRQSNFFVKQMMIPDLLFLMLAYCGFFVDPKAAPARAAMALFPVLIMRTLNNAVYASLPQVSKRMWLCDYLLASMIICCIGAVEFAIVQYCLIVESRCDSKFKALLKHRTAAQELIKQAQKQGTTVIELLDQFEPVQVDGQILSYVTREAIEESISLAQQSEKSVRSVSVLSGSPRSPESELPNLDIPKERLCELGGKMETEAVFAVDMESNPRSPSKMSFAKKPSKRGSFLLANQEVLDHEVHGAVLRSGTAIEGTLDDAVLTSAKSSIGKLTEADLTIVVYTYKIFERYGKGCEGRLPPYLVRHVLTHFNIYLTTLDTAHVMCAFLRDCGRPTPVVTSQVTIRFGQFMEFLFDVENYMLAIPERVKHPFSRAMPMSIRCDHAARWFFPLLVILKILFWFCSIDAYDSTDLGI